MFNDDWMNVVFLKRKLKAEDVIKDHIDKPLIVARTEELVSHAIERMRNIKFTNTGNGYVGFVGSWMSLTCFKVMYMIKTQPKDQLRKSWEVPTL
jgi:cystathionine beta-synthase